MQALLEADDRGIRCELGGFWVDPWKPVAEAVITHGHADHARPGSERYHAAAEGRWLLERRLPGADIVYHDYGERFRLGDAMVSLHPAGHVLGSAQVRVEPVGGGPVWVAAGDYKRQADPTCTPFEVIPCDAFITEATFALPAYRWDKPGVVGDEMLSWHLANRDAGRTSVLLCYALGKAQRALAEVGLAAKRRGVQLEPVLTHGAVEPLVEAYRASGIDLPMTRHAKEVGRSKAEREAVAGALVLAPPSAAGTTWLRRFGPSTRVETGFVSGWMRIRGVRRRRGHDRGFVMSDHADWPDLIRTIDQTGARTILATHGNSDALTRYLNESRDVEARALETAFVGEEDATREEQSESEQANTGGES